MARFTFTEEEQQAFHQDGKGLVLYRFYIANDRVYQVIVLGPEALVRSKDSLKFLDSFELVK